MNQAKKPRIIAFVNQKGGVLKTTLAAQVAYGLARSGLKVLAIDMDPQGNLSQAHNFRPDLVFPLNSTLAALTRKAIANTYETAANLRLIPSDITLAKAEMGFIGLPDSHALLTKALSRSLGDLYPTGLDYVIIDSPPNLGLLTLNTLYAATEVIIPLTCDSYAMNGVAALLETIEIIQETNSQLQITGYAACKVDMRRNIDQQSILKMTEVFGEKLFKSFIPESTALKVAGGLGVSIWDHDHRTLACASISALCAEIIERDPRE